MSFFERFKPKKSEVIKEVEGPIRGQRDYSLDNARKELNQDLKTQRIISLKDKLEPGEEINIVASAQIPEDSKIIDNNIMTLMGEIEQIHQKIKQLEDSIVETENMEALGERPVITADRYRELIKSLEIEIRKKEDLIEEEKDKLKDSFSVN